MCNTMFKTVINVLNINAINSYLGPGSNECTVGDFAYGDTILLKTQNYMQDKSILFNIVHI